MCTHRWKARGCWRTRWYLACERAEVHRYAAPPPLRVEVVVLGEQVLEAVAIGIAGHQSIAEVRGGGGLVKPGRRLFRADLRQRAQPTSVGRAIAVVVAPVGANLGGANPVSIPIPVPGASSHHIRVVVVDGPVAVVILAVAHLLARLAGHALGVRAGVDGRIGDGLDCLGGQNGEEQRQERPHRAALRPVGVRGI